MPKRWNEDSFTGEFFCSSVGLKNSWQFISYDYVGEEQVQGALNAYAKIFSVNIIAGFLNVLNQLIESRMENFVFFKVK